LQPSGLLSEADSQVVDGFRLRLVLDACFGEIRLELLELGRRGRGRLFQLTAGVSEIGEGACGVGELVLFVAQLGGIVGDRRGGRSVVAKEVAWGCGC